MYVKEQKFTEVKNPIEYIEQNWVCSGGRLPGCAVKWVGAANSPFYGMVLCDMGDKTLCYGFFDRDELAVLQLPSGELENLPDVTRLYHWINEGEHAKYGTWNEVVK